MLKDVRPEQMATTVLGDLLRRAGNLDPSLIDDVIIGYGGRPVVDAAQLDDYLQRLHAGEARSAFSRARFFPFGERRRGARAALRSVRCPAPERVRRGGMTREYLPIRAIRVRIRVVLRPALRTTQQAQLGFPHG